MSVRRTNPSVVDSDQCGSSFSFGSEAAHNEPTPPYTPGTAQNNDNPNGSAHTNVSGGNMDQCNSNPSCSNEAAHNGPTPPCVSDIFDQPSRTGKSLKLAVSVSTYVSDLT